MINRHLILLYALLRSGRDVEESAEFATHLMYSAFLTPPCADYLKSCVAEIYGVGPGECDMSFHRSLETRGGGKLYTVQTTMGIKRPVEMAMSTYGFTKARRSHQEALLHISDIDNRERFLMKLKPSHRLVLTRFWETGVLAPFFLNTASFNKPNRYFIFFLSIYINSNIVLGFTSLLKGSIWVILVMRTRSKDGISLRSRIPELVLASILLISSDVFSSMSSPS